MPSAYCVRSWRAICLRQRSSCFSQDSVAGVVGNMTGASWQFTAESNRKNLKNGQHLSKLTNIKWHVFYGPRCILGYRIQQFSKICWNVLFWATLRDLLNLLGRAIEFQTWTTKNQILITRKLLKGKWWYFSLQAIYTVLRKTSIFVTLHNS